MRDLFLYTHIVLRKYIVSQGIAILPFIACLYMLIVVQCER